MRAFRKSFGGLAALLVAWASLPLMAEPALETAPVEKQRKITQFWLDGVVEATNQTTVSAQTSGQIIELFYDVDDVVEKNAIIARLKDTEQQAQLAKAEAALTETEARLREATDAHGRTSGVFAKQAVSRSEMDKATANLMAARAKRDAAYAGRESAREQLEYTVIRAPYAGIVTERHMQIGEMVAPGQPVMSGLSLEALRVNVSVPQRIIPIVREKRVARVKIPGSDESVAAERLVVFPYADAATNTFKVRLDLPSDVPTLFPGMFVKAGFVTGEREVLATPKSSVVRRGEVTAVYVLDDEGRVSFRHVRLGQETDEGGLIVLAGLHQGERVALDPVAATAVLKHQRQGVSDNGND